MQRKNQRMAADMLFYRMLQDKYSLLNMMDELPNFKFSETVMQIMWTYVVIRDVVKGVSIIN